MSTYQNYIPQFQINKSNEQQPQTNLIWTQQPLKKKKNHRGKYLSVKDLLYHIHIANKYKLMTLKKSNLSSF